MTQSMIFKFLFICLYFIYFYMIIFINCASTQNKEKSGVCPWKQGLRGKCGFLNLPWHINSYEDWAGRELPIMASLGQHVWASHGCWEPKTTENSPSRPHSPQFRTNPQTRGYAVD